MHHQHPKRDGDVHTPGNASGNRKGLDDEHASRGSPARHDQEPATLPVNTDEHPTADVGPPQHHERARKRNLEPELHGLPPGGSLLDLEFEEASRESLRELQKEAARAADDDGATPEIVTPRDAIQRVTMSTTSGSDLHPRAAASSPRRSSQRTVLARGRASRLPKVQTEGRRPRSRGVSGVSGVLVEVSMRRYADWSRWVLLSVLLVLLTSPACAAVEGIFRAGVWVGILISVLVLGLILWLFVGRRT